MAKRRKVGNLLALALLALLNTGRPTHPYEMAQLLRRTGKDRDMNIKWGSLYTVVGNLEKHGLIEATGSDREGRRPERTSYVITEAGRAELKDWVRELVAEPDVEFPRFEAGLSVAGVLAPDEVTSLLHTRVQALTDEIAASRTTLTQATAEIPRIFLIESEYALAMREAELSWVRSLLVELAEGTLSGLAEWRSLHETGQMSPELLDLFYEKEAGLPKE